MHTQYQRTRETSPSNTSRLAAPARDMNASSPPANWDSDDEESPEKVEELPDPVPAVIEQPQTDDAKLLALIKETAPASPAVQDASVLHSDPLLSRRSVSSGTPARPPGLDLPTPEKPKAKPEEIEWQYRDPSGTVQGVHFQVPLNSKLNLTL